MRVVFMGTPDIAATCLKRILDDGFEVVGVYTQPDRPKGRGMKMMFSPVKEYALTQGIPVYQPSNCCFDTDTVLTNRQISVMPLTIQRVDLAVYDQLKSLNEG